MRTWKDNMATIAGLWPQYAPTPQEAALFAERLGHRRQDWLEEALKRHRSEDHDGAYKPRLSRIIAHYDEIRQSGDRGDDLPSPFSKWRAAWDKPDGTKWATAHLFDSESAALAFARSQGLDPSAMPVGGKVGKHPEERLAEECEADAQSVLADMLEWTPKRRGAAVAELKRLGVAELFGPTSYPDDVRQWSRTARGLAHAADERMRAKR